ncbi:dynamin related protein 1 isoform a [Anaeramoeba flamelloides]|uniref:Dynamin related protein 1 isoform a n=1 Tax=Anaeramoeba flamelloides TaxID=1746091 RepID=A0AAV7YUI3_9EUKA|nr:dynamin related protein 1 isoform a [Anaeramoeba flamelloides]
MNNLNVVVNKIQDILAQTKITTFELPQIVVVGEQSSGKSSVLESIVKMDFLPRGNNIVTRRPLILQLNKIQTYKKEKKKSSSSKRNEINKEKEKKKKGKNNLGISSPDTVNLTLIDLPGLTNNPILNQKKDLPERIYKMVVQYIRNPKSLILCVIPANIDIANSRAYKLAKEIDPRGERTLGILTKIDLMDEGTNARDILFGKVLPLKYGYVPVFNRSQKQIKKNISVKESIKLEKIFFQNHQSYKDISKRCGTKYLSKRLSELFTKRMEIFLPEIRKKVTLFRIKWEEELKTFEQSKIEGNNSTFLMKLIFEFSKKNSDLINGVDLFEDEHMKFLQGGSRINYIFYEIFTNYIQKVDPLEGLTEKELILLMKNSKGPKKTLFIPDKTFEILVKTKLEQFRAPSQSCVKSVFRELESIIISKIKVDQLSRFKLLKEKIIQKSINYLNSLVNPCLDFVNQTIDTELAFINLNHPDFKKPTHLVSRMTQSKQTDLQKQKVPNQQQKLQKKQNQRQKQQQQQQLKHRLNNNNHNSFLKSPSPNMFIGMLREYEQLDSYSYNELKIQQQQLQSTKRDNLSIPKNIQDFSIQEYEKQEIRMLKDLLINYVDIVKIKLIDTIPKIIMHLLVNKLADNLQNVLIQKLYKPKKIDILLAENPEIARKRKNCERKVHAYRKAEKILSQDISQILD